MEMMRTTSAIPRDALVSLLTHAEQAAAEGDDASASALLSDLHWFAHGDGSLHQAVHRLELDMARRRGDIAGAVGQVLPNVFARAVSFVESRCPSFEVVQEIGARPDCVYGILSDVKAYSAWNPWISNGDRPAVRVDDDVKVDVKLGKRTMRVGHRVLVAAPPGRFGWRDLGWFTLFAGGRRLRWIEPLDGGSRFVSQIQLYGPFAHLAWRLYGKTIRAGMTAEASALATRAATLSKSESAASN
jgi:hypothetical protein